MDYNTILNSILKMSFFSNKYINAIIVFLVFFVLAKIFLWVSQRIILKLTKKTKTEIDDHIVEKTSVPFSFIIVFVGLLIAIKLLKITGTVYDAVKHSLQSLIVIGVTHIIITILVILIEDWGNKWAQKTESKGDDQLVILFRKFTVVIGWILGIIYVLTVWNIQIGPLIASLGIAGVAVAFALQQSLGNIFGGISMLVDRAIKVDDVIELQDGTSGRVLDVGIRSTKIRTWDNEIIIIPNGELANSKLKNIVLPEPKVRVVVPFSVAYGSDVVKVKEIILDIVKDIDGFIEDPAPFVIFREMADSSLNFRLYFWVDSYSKRFMAKDEANMRIYKVLNEKGFEIPFPQMDVHIRKEDHSAKNLKEIKVEKEDNVGKTEEEIKKKEDEHME